MGVKKLATAVKDDQLKGAPRAVLEDLFDDFYRHRKQVYWMNFVRGIVFGFGTVIGGTIMVALLLWILSLLNYIPFLEGIVDAAQESLKNRGR
ncbi:MAG TPA: DUF5665 domain-containing protein [Candidatus Saccharimonadales bacterium]|nr:DUF5665 domain-containing protein [Candidatus Saccharimonadales bacterium]